jgi:hypothetical protein
MISAMNIFGETWTDRRLYYLSERVDSCVARLEEKIDRDFKFLDKWSESRADRLEKRMDREFARVDETIRELRKG